MTQCEPLEHLNRYLDRIAADDESDSLECMKVYMLYYLYSNNQETTMYLRKQLNHFTSDAYKAENVEAHNRNVDRIRRELNLRENMLSGFLKRELELPD